jgi:hypothetical protein
MPGQHQQPGCYEFLALPCGACEPATGDGAGALGSDVVAALCDLGEAINQQLQFGPVGVSKASPWSSEDKIWFSVDIAQFERMFDLCRVVSGSDLDDCGPAQNP